MFEIDLSLLPDKKRAYPETLTEEDALMESLFEVSPKRNKPDYRPVTPPETRSLRALIDNAFEQEQNSVSEPQVSSPPPLVGTTPELSPDRSSFKEMCKHAGILREYGGVKAFMSLDFPAASALRREEQCR